MNKSHGQSSIERKGNLLIIDSTGPFNLSFVQDYNKKIEIIISQMPEVWGQVVTTDEYFWLTPQAEEGMEQACKSRKQRGCCVSAILFPEGSSASVTVAQMSRVYTYAGIEFEFFTDHQLAEQWVITHLAKYIE
mgnify:CR=1 FL=1